MPRRLTYEAALAVLDLRERFEHLFLFRSHGLELIFRQLTVAELRSLSRAELPDWICDDWTCSKAVLYCPGGPQWVLNEAPAGLAQKLAQAILVASTPSGDKAIHQEIQKHRKEQDTLLDKLETILCKGLGMPLGQVRDMTLAKILSYLPIAETLAGMTLEPGGKPKPGTRPGPRPPRPGFQSTAPIDFEADNKALSELL